MIRVGAYGAWAVGVLQSILLCSKDLHNAGFGWLFYQELLLRFLAFRIPQKSTGFD